VAHPAEEQTCRQEAVECRPKLRLRLAHHGLQEGVRELASHCCADLCDFLRWAEPVEARHQRCVEACGNPNGRRWNSCSCSLSFPFAFSFQHCPCHFLNEQRDAVGAFDDVLSDTLWQRFVARYAVNHCSDFALAEAI
jgi:hypothetical protein